MNTFIRLKRASYDMLNNLLQANLPLKNKYLGYQDVLVMFPSEM